MTVFGEEAVEQFVDSDRRWLLGLGLVHRAFFTFATFVTGSMMEDCPGHLVHLVNSESKFRN